ncbi:MAG: phospholipase A2 [Desulfopila sp.]
MNIFPAVTADENHIIDRRHDRYRFLCAWRSLPAAVCGLFLLLSPTTGQAGSAPYISGHQVNFATGNKYLQETDYSTSGPGLALSVTREYNSQSELRSPLGFGWSVNLFDRLEIAADSIVHIRSGGRHTLYSIVDGKWVNEVGRKRVIVQEGSQYRLTASDGGVQVFNGDGALVSMADKNGNSHSYTYDAGLLTTVTDSFGRTINYTYDNGSVTAMQTPQGIYSYSYDANDNLISVTRPDNSTRQYLYEDARDIHNLTGIVDETDQRVLAVVYDDEDRVISSAQAGGLDAVQISYGDDFTREVTDALGVTTSYALKVDKGIASVESAIGPGCSSCGSQGRIFSTYNERLQVSSMTDARGIVTKYSYDDAGNRTRKVEAVGTVNERATSWEYAPDTAWRTRTIEPAVAGSGATVETVYSYDTAGNLLTREKTIASPDGDVTRTTTYSYDSLGRIATIDGPRDDVADVVSFTYYANDAAQGNNRGQLHTITNGLGHLTVYSDYNAFGLPERIADANGLTTESEYDSRGQLLSRIVGTLTSRFAYDSAGRLESVTAPGSRTIRYQYDGMGLIARITDNLGNSIVFAYDARGQGIRREIQDSTGALQRYQEFVYDESGRLTATINPDGSRSKQDYDEVGHLVAIINEMGQQTDYTIDSLGRITKVLAPGEETTSFVYNNGDLQISVTDAEGHLTSFIHDDFGNRIGRVSPESGTTTYRYDIAGNLMTATQDSGTVVGYRYDAVNRPVTVTVNGVESQTIVYDTAAGGTGHLAQITDSSGSTSYSYTVMGQIDSESRSSGSLTLTSHYGYDDATGELSTITYPSGLKVTYLYDTVGRINGLQFDDVTVMGNASYLPFGPVTAYDFGQGLQARRSYDQRYQLMALSAGGLHYHFTRDPLGRVTTIEGVSAPIATSDAADYSYQPGSSRLVQITNPSGPRAYALDANGNTVSDGVFAFSYDGLNRLVTVEREGVIVASYTYDAYNRRTSKTVDAETTYYAYDQSGNLLTEVDETGTTLRDYIYLDGALFAVKIYGSGDAATVYYALNDHLGTPQQLVDSIGTVVWQAVYDPFGKAQVQVETIVNNIRFPGQYFDAETGLHYNWHRFYDPETGRYISADPIGLAGGINLYAYVQNDPVNVVDPEGLKTCGSGWNEPLVPDNPFGFCFSSCCAAHDKCYGCDGKRQGKSKRQCDDEFKQCMYSACNKVTHKLSRGSCKHKAQVYHGAVDKYGQGAFNDARQRQCCTP